MRRFLLLIATVIVLANSALAQIYPTNRIDWFAKDWLTCDTTEDCRGYRGDCGDEVFANVKHAADAQKALCDDELRWCGKPCSAPPTSLPNDSFACLNGLCTKLNK